MKHTFIFIICIILSASLSAQGVSFGDKDSFDDKGNIKMRSSLIQARQARHLHAPTLGFPQYVGGASYGQSWTPDYSERIQWTGKYWLSLDPATESVNWITWDLQPGAIGDARYPIAELKKAGPMNVPASVIQGVLDECYKWALESPVKPTTVACGPMGVGATSGSSHAGGNLAGEQTSGNLAGGQTGDNLAGGQTGGNLAGGQTGGNLAGGQTGGNLAGGQTGGGIPAPSAYFIVVCRKARTSLGWKSIGFIIPNDASISASNPFRLSECVNIIESRTGYDFFHRLPSNLEEIIEEITAAELFCPIIEFDAHRDDPLDPESADELNADYYDDLRESAL